MSAPHAEQPLRRHLARALFRMDAPDASDWDALHAFAARYELEASLSFAVASSSVASPAVIRRAKADLAVRAFLDHERDLRLVRVLEALEAHGIEPLLLKGLALRASGLLPPGARATRDVDLLVAPHEADAADAVLASLGARHPAWTDWIGFDGHSLGQSLVRRPHATLPRVLDDVLVLDLHRSLPGRAATAPADYRAIRAHAIDGTLLGRTVRVPSYGHQRFLLCDHVAGHHLWEPHHRSRHLADLLAFADVVPTPPGTPDPDLGRPAGGALHRRLVDDVYAFALDQPLPVWSIAHGFAQEHPALESHRRRAEALARWLSDARERPALLARKLIPHHAYFEWAAGRSLGPREVWRMRFDRLRGRLPLSPYEERFTPSGADATERDPTLPRPEP